MVWLQEVVDGVCVFRPREVNPGLVVAFSGAGTGPDEEPSATAWLARRFAAALGLDGVPIVRATQVHGTRAVTVGDVSGNDEVAGVCDLLVTDRAGVALVVQTADCVPIVLASPQAVGVAHAGWRGTAAGAAREAVAALGRLGVPSETIRAWLGPSIRSCCYEVGGEVAARFAGDLVRASCSGRFRVDLAAANRAQLEASGVPAGSIATHPACTCCGGEGYASYRRDGTLAGRMIALVMRISPAGPGRL